MKLLFMAFFLSLSSLTWGQGYLGIEAHGHVCGFTSTEVTCWGKNNFGEATSSSGYSNIRQLRSWYNFSCLTDDLGMVCFGKAPVLPLDLSSSPNVADFRLGDNQVCGLLEGKILCSDDAHAPAPPASLDHVSAFDFEGNFFCAVQDKKVTCWGQAQFDSFREKLLDIPSDLGDVLKVEVEATYICILNTKKEIRCWGYDTESIKDVPPDLGRIADFTTGYSNMCAINEAGVTRCWGRGTYNQNMPVGIKAKILSGSGVTVCILDEKGEAHCWGRDNALLQPPANLPAFSSMVANEYNTCFTTPNEIFCTGSFRGKAELQVGPVSHLALGSKMGCYNVEGGPKCFTFDTMYPQLAEIPLQVKEVTQFSFEEQGVCAIYDSGNLSCWGLKDFEEFYPRDLQGVLKLSSASFHTCALTDKNLVSCWGYWPIQSEYKVEGKIVDLISRNNFDCVRTDGDYIQCWGDSELKYPSILTPPDHLIAIKGWVAGRDFICAYNENQISCWGNPADGRLETPYVKGRIKQVTAGSDHACFEDEEKVKCWGQNRNSQYSFIQN